MSFRPTKLPIAIFSSHGVHRYILAVITPSSRNTPHDHDALPHHHLPILSITQFTNTLRGVEYSSTWGSRWVACAQPCIAVCLGAGGVDRYGPIRAEH